MDKVTGEDLGTKVCDALGLEPSKVRKITITLPSNGPALVKAEQYVNAEEADRLFNIISKRYHLVEADESEGTDG